MRTRLVILVAVAISAAATVFMVTLSASFLSGSPGTSVSLPPDHSSYLGVYETGPPQTYQPVADFTRMAAAQPRRILQRLEGTFQDLVREDGPRAWRGHDRADRSHSYLRLGHRRW